MIMHLPCTYFETLNTMYYYDYKSIQWCALHELNTSCIIIFVLYYMSIVYITCKLYILALVEPSKALLPTTCHPKAVGGVCYGTVTDCMINTS